jgi:hypothetical protein
MRSAIFYYGLDLPPDKARAMRLRDAMVVLQPYHPLLTGDLFAAYFPHCSLFVYWNPTGVQPEALRGVSERIELLGVDPAWGLVRLDLRSAATRRFAVSQGLRALHDSGACVDGLFVDDLDLWSGGRRQVAAATLVSTLLADADRDVGLFLNRAFSFWPKIPDLRAVLLEELTPGMVARMAPGEVEWVKRKVLPAVRRARRLGTAIFGLTYDPVPEATAQCGLSAELGELSDQIITACRSLDTWPEELR